MCIRDRIRTQRRGGLFQERETLHVSDRPSIEAVPVQDTAEAQPAQLMIMILVLAAFIVLAAKDPIIHMRERAV